MPEHEPQPTGTPFWKPGVPILTAITTVGLGTVIGVYWMLHSMREANDNREYLQETLIETLQASTAASERVAAHIEESNDITQDFATQLDDLSDEQRQLNRYVEVMLRAHLESEEKASEQ